MQRLIPDTLKAMAYIDIQQNIFIRVITDCYAKEHPIPV